MAYLPKAKVKRGGYPQKSVRERILAFFLDNIGKVAARHQVEEAATDPITGKVPENWHQRLSELRTDFGYTILSHRDRADLKASEYLMQSDQRRKAASKRVKPTTAAWTEVLQRAKYTCEWNDDGKFCSLTHGSIDPVGGGTVKLTPDHLTPHSLNPASDPNDPVKWRALCGRHQVMKKNFWDSSNGKLNYVAIVQAAPREVKAEVYEMLKRFFGES